MYFMTVQLTFPKTACLFSNKKQNYKVLPSNLIFSYYAMSIIFAYRWYVLDELRWLNTGHEIIYTITLASFSLFQ